MGYRVEDAVARFNNRYIEYHIEFFGNGLNAVIRKWLENDCREAPEEIYSIIQEEYKGIAEPNTGAAIPGQHDPT